MRVPHGERSGPTFLSLLRCFISLRLVKGHVPLAGEICGKNCGVFSKLPSSPTLPEFAIVLPSRLPLPPGLFWAIVYLFVRAG
ncbi:Hypothetical predicted protein [Podarcis lilfordi]|nr:Hypothetical predicted protein [Podarcis lilfordi]